MKYIKLFEQYTEKYKEVKYTPEQKKLITQLRYRINKYFGQNCCGVFKVRYIAKNKYGYPLKYEPYSGSTMLFNIYFPNFIAGEHIPNYNEKMENLREVLKEIGMPLGINDTNLDVTEEQMEELISKLQYIEDYIIAKKYNL
jgi:hypothetical protein